MHIESVTHSCIVFQPLRQVFIRTDLPPPLHRHVARTKHEIEVTWGTWGKNGARTNPHSLFGKQWVPLTEIIEAVSRASRSHIK